MSKDVLLTIFKMRLICLWCALVAIATAQVPSNDRFYAPQTFKQHGSPRGLFQPMHRPWNTMMRIPNRIEAYQQSLFKPSAASLKNDVIPQSSYNEPWRPAYEPWKPLPAAPQYSGGPSEGGQFSGAQTFPSASKPVEPWRPPLTPSKEQQAHILHHKQALTSEGNFRYEYASDNGLAAGEVIEPDGSRVGAYQYKDPNGQIVKLKYRAGKDGFQILEGSHLPKSPEPVAPPQQETHYQQAFQQQQQQYQLQQQYNQEKHKQPLWTEQNQGPVAAPAGNQYFNQNWQNRGKEDDGQYRENELDQDPNNKGPHNFGEGYAFAFQG